MVIVDAPMSGPSQEQRGRRKGVHSDRHDAEGVERMRAFPLGQPFGGAVDPDERGRALGEVVDLPPEPRVAPVLRRGIGGGDGREDRGGRRAS